MVKIVTKSFVTQKSNIGIILTQKLKKDDSVRWKSNGLLLLKYLWKFSIGISKWILS